MPKLTVPTDLESSVTDWKMSRGLEHDGIVFLTGLSGADAGGVLSEKPAEQIEAVFQKIEMVLKKVGLGFRHLVAMTSYHVGLRDHLKEFREKRSSHVTEPFRAWIGIDVAGFVQDGVCVEIRCIARNG